MPGDIDKLIFESMDKLLNRARLPTLESWVEQAADRFGETPTLLVARAEIALRQGRHLTAQALADRASRSKSISDRVGHRAFLVGGKAAHIGSRENDALDFYVKAETSATSDAERRHARWGQLTAAAALELDSAHDLLTELEASASTTLDPTESVRTADKRVALGLRFGAVHGLAEAKRVSELLPSVPDPFVRNSFRSMFAYALNLAAEYERALEVTTAMVDDPRSSELTLPCPMAFHARRRACGAEAL